MNNKERSPSTDVHEGARFYEERGSINLDFKYSVFNSELYHSRIIYFLLKAFLILHTQKYTTS